MPRSAIRETRRTTRTATASPAATTLRPLSIPGRRDLPTYCFWHRRAADRVGRKRWSTRGNASVGLPFKMPLREFTRRSRCEFLPVRSLFVSSRRRAGSQTFHLCTLDAPLARRIHGRDEAHRKIFESKNENPVHELLTHFLYFFLQVESFQKGSQMGSAEKSRRVDGTQTGVQFRS